MKLHIPQHGTNSFHQFTLQRGIVFNISNTKWNKYIKVKMSESLWMENCGCCFRQLDSFSLELAKAKKEAYNINFRRNLSAPSSSLTSFNECFCCDYIVLYFVQFNVLIAGFMYVVLNNADNKKCMSVIFETYHKPSGPITLVNANFNATSGTVGQRILMQALNKSKAEKRSGCSSALDSLS